MTITRPLEPTSSAAMAMSTKTKDLPDLVPATTITSRPSSIAIAALSCHGHGVYPNIVCAASANLSSETFFFNRGHGALMARGCVGSSDGLGLPGGNGAADKIGVCWELSKGVGIVEGLYGSL